MAIEILETFTVAAPADRVWRFLLDPARVVTCVPGAQLDQVVDDRTFLGTVRVQVGAIATSYQGRIRLVEVDESQHAVQMVAEGREAGGGTARGTMTSRLQPLPDGGTEVRAEARVDLTGRILQMGRGMIRGVSHELFQQFVARVREQLEVGHEVTATGAAAADPAPLRILPVFWKVLCSSIARFFRRLLRRPPA